MVGDMAYGSKYTDIRYAVIRTDGTKELRNMDQENGSYAGPGYGLGPYMN